MLRHVVSGLSICWKDYSGASKSSFLPISSSKKPPLPLVHLLPTALAVTASPSYLTSSTLPPSSSLTPPPAVSVPTTGVSPGRSSLVSRRMHGPRLDGGNQSRRQRRKTVTWDEKCDVVKISGDEHDTDSESVGEQMDQEEPGDDPSFRGGQPANEERMSEEVSYEANDLSDTYGDGNDTTVEATEAPDVLLKRGTVEGAVRNAVDASLVVETDTRDDGRRTR
ncbi:hypothetical protein H0H92_009709 [Tricholoma furcatifolium]|nr:hypothetical protein H0H92_009709 [Tricholoma furcatifolium]